MSQLFLVWRQPLLGAFSQCVLLAWRHVLAVRMGLHVAMDHRYCRSGRHGSSISTRSLLSSFLSCLESGTYSVSTWVISQYSSALYFEMGSVADPEAHHIQSLSSRDPPAPASLWFGSQGHTITPAYSYGCWGPELSKGLRVADSAISLGPQVEVLFLLCLYCFVFWVFKINLLSNTWVCRIRFLSFTLQNFARGRVTQWSHSLTTPLELLPCCRDFSSTTLFFSLHLTLTPPPNSCLPFREEF